MLRPLIALAIPLSLVLACNGGDDSASSDDAPPGGAVDLPDSALQQIEALLAEKEARTPAQRKISSQLLYEKSGRFVFPESKDDDQIRPLSQHDEQGRVLVDIAGDPAQVAARVEALGGAIAVRGKSVRAWMPLGKLEDLAADGAVRAVRGALAATTWRTDAPYGAKFYTGGSPDR